VVRPAKGKRMRRLTDVEYRQLAMALDAARKTEWPAVSDIIQFTALTGWRVGEVCLLRWEQVNIDARLAVIEETKTGLSRRPLSGHAVGLLEARRSSPNATGYVFPAIDGGPVKRLCSGKKGKWARSVGQLWDNIDPATNERITAHTLRHTFVSLGVELGFSLSTVGAIVGHATPEALVGNGEGRQSAITAGYAHVADPVLLKAVDEISNRIAALMAGSNVVSLDGRRRLAELRESA
jgi:integrase